MTGVNNGCLLCRLGYRVPAVQTPIVHAMVTDRTTVYLCRYHEKLLHDWSDEKEHKEMLRIMAPHIYRGRRPKGGTE